MLQYLKEQQACFVLLKLPDESTLVFIQLVLGLWLIIASSGNLKSKSLCSVNLANEITRS